ncbi:uncharacterized protein [Coffea arabica]|uniref:Uncharacterized protein n=1 Tax=Coffea arabica TaxID=13443 RepID=A0ABM4W3L9_COFAR
MKTSEGGKNGCTLYSTFMEWPIHKQKHNQLQLWMPRHKNPSNIPISWNHYPPRNTTYWPNSRTLRLFKFPLVLAPFIRDKIDAPIVSAIVEPKLLAFTTPRLVLIQWWCLRKSHFQMKSISLSPIVMMTLVTKGQNYWFISLYKELTLVSGLLTSTQN